MRGRRCGWRSTPRSTPAGLLDSPAGWSPVRLLRPAPRASPRSELPGQPRDQSSPLVRRPAAIWRCWRAFDQGALDVARRVVLWHVPPGRRSVHWRRWPTLSGRQPRRLPAPRQPRPAGRVHPADRVPPSRAPMQCIRLAPPDRPATVLQWLPRQPALGGGWDGPGTRLLILPGRHLPWACAP